MINLVKCCNILCRKINPNILFIQQIITRKQMQKISSSSAYDTIVIRQENNVFKSTSFQVVFSSASLKNKLKKDKEIELFVNDQNINVNIRLDHNTGRVEFEKKYQRKGSVMSDSSDLSEDDSNSQRSKRSISKERKFQNGITVPSKIDDLKNEQAPKTFWQFAWLFQKKKEDQVPLKPSPAAIFEDTQSALEKIKQEDYQGQQNSKQPLYQLSLCGSEIKKVSSKEQILKKFYKHKLEYSAFMKDPTTIFNDSNLVVRIDDSIYTWQLGLVILTCRYAYGKQLSPDQINDIIKNKFTRGMFSSMFSSSPGITKVDIVSVTNENQTKDIKINQIKENFKIKYGKTPPSTQIEKMNLKYGLNKAKLVLNFANQTTQQICFNIFLWNYNQKIIISDIDGTITKSDVLGQILSNYIHEGVIKLFNEIQRRNYKIIYLTARAIGQYQQTIKFLQSAQQSNQKLPPGPLLMSPDGYMLSFKREVIDKTPDYLKTRILAQLNEIFPNSSTPMYCGFGNRVTDSIAYLKINIPAERIYNISQKSVIKQQSNPNFVTSYSNMLQNIDNFFPIYDKNEVSILPEESDVKFDYNNCRLNRSVSEVNDEKTEDLLRKSLTQSEEKEEKKQEKLEIMSLSRNGSEQSSKKKFHQQSNINNIKKQDLESEKQQNIHCFNDISEKMIVSLPNI